MRILVACEESQRVTMELRRLGHEVYSCDIIEPSGGHPEWHIQQDVIPLLNGNCRFTDNAGGEHEIDGTWDMIIAHPPCTYLSNVATRSFSLRCTAPEKVVERWGNRAKAAVFFMQFALADCPKIAVENPVGYMSTAYRKPDQIIQPYQFAPNIDDEDYVTKKTCLWLKGLPKLETNSLPAPDNAKLFGKMQSGKNKTWEDITHGAKKRSKTFPGIARAMAEQWAGKVTEDLQ